MTMRTTSPLDQPGLQPERTQLAWRRTTLAATTVTLLAAGVVVRHNATAVRLLALAIIAGVWLAILALSQRRISALSKANATTAPARVTGKPARLALLVVGLAMVSVLVVV